MAWMCHRRRVKRVLSVGLGMAAPLAALASSLAAILLQPLGFNQHVLWISVPLLPLLAQPSKPCPVILLPAVQGFNKLKVDASPRLFNHHLEFTQEFGAKEWQPPKPLEIAEDILKGLVECEQGLVGTEFLLHHRTPAASRCSASVSQRQPKPSHKARCT